MDAETRAVLWAPVSSRPQAKGDSMERQDVVEMWLYGGEQNLVGHAAGTFMVLPGLEFP